MKQFDITIDEYSKNSGRLLGTENYKISVADDDADNLEFILWKLRGEWTEVEYTIDGVKPKE